MYALDGPPELCLEMVPHRGKIQSGFDEKKHFVVDTVQRGEEAIVLGSQIFSSQ